MLELLGDVDYDNLGFAKVLITVPNIVDKDVTFLMSGWNIKLHSDGTWTVEITSK